MTEKKPVGRPPERLTLNVVFHAGLSQEPTVETYIWPKNWPLPVVGDSITSSSGLTRRVQRYAFHPTNNILTIEAS